MLEPKKSWAIFISLGFILGFFSLCFSNVGEATPWEYTVDSDSFSFVHEGIEFFSGKAYLIKHPDKGEFKVKLWASTREDGVTIIPRIEMRFGLGYTGLVDRPYPGIYWGPLNFNFTTILGEGPDSIVINTVTYDVDPAGDSISISNVNESIAGISVCPHEYAGQAYDGYVKFSVTLTSQPIPFTEWKGEVPVYIRWDWGLFTWEDTLYLSYPMSVSKIVEAPSKVSLGQSFTIKWRVTNEYEYRIENVKVHSYVYLYKYETGETICYNIGGWDANAQYIDLEPGENRDLVQTITLRSDVEPSAETKLKVVAVIPLQEAENAVYYTRAINVVPPPDSGVIWIFPSDDATVAESYPNAPPTYRIDRIGIRSWDNSHDDIEDYRNIRSFLKFDLSEIPRDVEILNAELHLYCYYTGYTMTGVTDVQVWSTRDDWTENTVTWDNQPWQGGDILDVWVPPEYVDTYGWPRVWASWTVTDFVKEEFEGDWKGPDTDGIASFCLRAATESYDNQWRNVYFRSKDYDGYDPHLVVTYTLSS